MDLSKLSDADLLALKAGDLTKVSDAGLIALKGADTGRGGIAQNIAGGALKGASEIGATLLSPVDAAARAMGIQNDFIGRNDRRQAVTDFMNGQGVNTESMAYGGGKLGAEVIGTAGIGGALAKTGLAGLSAVAPKAAGYIAPLLESIASGGMNVSGATGLAGLGLRAAGGAITGGATAGLVNPSDTAMGAAIGGAFPVVAKGISKGAGAIGNAIRGDVSPEVVDLYKKAQSLGIDIPADRIANSRPLNAVSSALNYVPFSGRAATEDAMNSQLNRAASRTFGQDSSNITMALRKADDVLGAKFEKTLTENGVKFDEQLLNDLADVYNRAERNLGADALKPIKAQINTLFEKGQSGFIDGQAAYNVKKELDRIGRGIGNEAFHAKELKSVLMDALDRSLGQEKAAQFATVRQQYGNMLELEKLARNGAEGEVSVARLANMKNINNPKLQDIADIAAQFVKPREGQHGAAQRAAAGAITFGLGGAPALAAGAVTGRAANTALNSQLMKSLMLNEPTPIVSGGLLNALQAGGYRVAPLLSGQ
jgi:hypothetical protein